MILVSYRTHHTFLYAMCIYPGLMRRLSIIRLKSLFVTSCNVNWADLRGQVPIPLQSKTIQPSDMGHIRRRFSSLHKLQICRKAEFEQPFGSNVKLGKLPFTAFGTKAKTLKYSFRRNHLQR